MTLIFRYAHPVPGCKRPNFGKFSCIQPVNDFNVFPPKWNFELKFLLGIQLEESFRKGIKIVTASASEFFIWCGLENPRLEYKFK